MEGHTATYSLMTLEQDLPDQLPSWAFEDDVLGGFGDFTDINLDSETFQEDKFEASDELATVHAPAGPETSVSAPAHAHALEMQPSTHEPSAGRPPTDPSKSISGAMRKQRQNREAQQRFRERQRVSDFAIEVRGLFIMLVPLRARARAPCGSARSNASI